MEDQRRRRGKPRVDVAPRSCVAQDEQVRKSRWTGSAGKLRARECTAQYNCQSRRILLVMILMRMARTRDRSIGTINPWERASL